MAELRIAPTLIARGDGGGSSPSAPPTPAAVQSPQERQLSDWLDVHEPGAAQPYAPSNTYCTKYVENVLKSGTGFDLYSAVQHDMSKHDPGFHLFGTTRDGYRFSSPINASGDPYDSNNVANYFRNQGELHPFTGNHGMHVGDVLFFSGDDQKGGLDHTAMVSKVDAHGHATEIVESTGSESVTRDWNTFEQKVSEQHKTLVEYGRPDFAHGR